MDGYTRGEIPDYQMAAFLMATFFSGMTDKEVGTMTELQRGKHTTTTARLLRWPFGGYVVDTPGTRQFELPGVDAEELEAYFAEFVPLIQDCRFKNCTHTHEIGCAVKAAVEEGRIAPERYDSYCKMHAECAARPRY